MDQGRSAFTIHVCNSRRTETSVKVDLAKLNLCILAKHVALCVLKMKRKIDVDSMC